MWQIGDKFFYKKNVYIIDRIEFYLGDYHYFSHRLEGSCYIYLCTFEREMLPVKSHYEQLSLFEV